MLDSFTVQTTKKEELINITMKITSVLAARRIQSGICLVYTTHTTAGITVNENADPAVPKDIIKGLAYLDLENVRFDHSEGNSPAHIKSSFFGCSQTLIVNEGSLLLGTWQGIFLCEFDGPRTRKVYIKCIPD